MSRNFLNFLLDHECGLLQCVCSGHQRQHVFKYTHLLHCSILLHALVVLFLQQDFELEISVVVLHPHELVIVGLLCQRDAFYVSLYLASLHEFGPEISHPAVQNVVDQASFEVFVVFLDLQQ